MTQPNELAVYSGLRRRSWRVRLLARKQTYFLLRWSQSRHVLHDLPSTELYLLLFPVNAGIHWRNSIQPPATYHDHLVHTARKAPTAAGAPKRIRRVVEINPTVLGQGPSLAPGSSGSLADSSRLVGASFTPAFVRLRTLLFSNLATLPHGNG